MSDTLPPLPEPAVPGIQFSRDDPDSRYRGLYTADQMRSYAAAALAAAASTVTPSQWEFLAGAQKLLDEGRQRSEARAERLAAAVAEPVASVTECEACFTPDVCQLRGTCDHYAAERLRVAAPPQREPYDQTALGLCNACGWKAVGPDGCLNCAPQREREPLTDEQIDAMAWFLVAEREYEAYTGQERLVVVGQYDFARAIERAHGISAPASAPKEQP